MNMRIENGRAYREGMGDDLKRAMGVSLTSNDYSEDCVEVPGYYGGNVPSTAAFRVFITAFEGFSLAFGKNLTLLNCTEGGAHIEGFEQRSLESFVSTLKDAPLLDVESDLQALDAKIDRPARKRKILDAIRRDLGRLDSIIELCGECTRHAQRRELKPLRSKERQLIKATFRFRLLDMLRQAKVREESLNANEATTLEQNIRASEALYEAVRDSAREMRPHFVSALDAVKKLP
jgi:hypothetical protein